MKFETVRKTLKLELKSSIAAMKFHPHSKKCHQLFTAATKERIRLPGEYNLWLIESADIKTIEFSNLNDPNKISSHKNGAMLIIPLKNHMSRISFKCFFHVVETYFPLLEKCSHE